MKKRKVLAGGRFNIIHPGHIYFLQKAKALGDSLVVVIASDKTVKDAKKPLLFPAQERRAMVDVIKGVDKTVIGYDIKGEAGYVKIIRDEKPDVIALGYDQKVDVKKLKNLARQAGVRCTIIRIKNFRGYQTKKIIKETKQGEK